MKTWIRNAQLVTGDGITEPFAGDVHIAGGRITHLGTVPESEQKSAELVIDADGRTLAPGFVDTHNHGALGGARIGEHGTPIACELALRAGVTKRICGVDRAVARPGPCRPAGRICPATAAPGRGPGRTVVLVLDRRIL